MPKLKTQCMTLPLNNSQQTALNEHSLYCCSYIVLLRSSTHNIVLPSLSSIASKFDSRVSHSEGDDGKQKENGNADSGAGFALVVGNKKVEQRLCLVDDVARQKEHSLSQEQLKELVKLVEVVEQAYGIPIE